MKIQAFHDSATSTLTYVVFDEATRVAVLIDSVLDFEAASGRTSTSSAERVARFLDDERLVLRYVLDTHAHADHLTAMPWFRDRFGAKSVIGREIVEVQRSFAEIFNLGEAFRADGSQFDRLLGDGERLDLGAFSVEAIHTPGHTPACMTYRIDDALFVGDTLFQPDYGTARCDFPGGSAEALWTSILRLYDTQPGDQRVFTCHDYQPGGRPVAYESTIDEQRRSNVQLDEGVSRDDFVAFRRERDATLGMPALIYPSIQVNIRAGRLPEPEANGRAYLKWPIEPPPARAQEPAQARG